ncbi:MAG: threonylcarbamoyl-AMP synthase [Phycisphaerales bacterium]|nr:threonylcarbamoyl-AMP synthase [Phycisphaerales bacterium]
MPDGPEEISAAIARLREGGLVAFPTETVYGLGADALSERAVDRVFAIKGRPANNPLIVHVSDIEMARRAAREWPFAAQKLAAAFWPGPLSIIVPKSSVIPTNVTAGADSVAVRCPDHPLTLALIEAFGSPLVGPSANPSGRISPTTADHVRESFSPDLVYVLDGGPCRGGIESTVVDVSGTQPRVLRPGLITPEMLANVLGQPIAGPGSNRIDMAAAGALPSPGLLPQHYAPVSPTHLIDRSDIRSMDAGAVLLVFDPIPDRRCIVMPREPLPYAARLYSALREADAMQPALIAIERPPVGSTEAERSVWLAIMDRLSRAAALSE